MRRVTDSSGEVVKDEDCVFRWTQQTGPCVVTSQGTEHSLPTHVPTERDVQFESINKTRYPPKGYGDEDPDDVAPPGQGIAATQFIQFRVAWAEFKDHQKTQRVKAFIGLWDAYLATK